MKKFLTIFVGVVVALFCVIVVAQQVPNARLLRGYILRGNSSNVTAPFDANDSGSILVGNGTDLTSTSITTAITTYAALAQGYIFRGSAAGAPEAFDANNSGNVLVGDGTDLTSTALTTAMNTYAPTHLKYVKTTLTAAAMNTLAATPVALVAGTANSITVFHTALVVLDYATAAFTGNYNITIEDSATCAGSVVSTTLSDVFFNRGADAATTMLPITTNYLTAAANPLYLCASADVVMGTATSEVDVHVWYSVVPTGL